MHHGVKVTFLYGLILNIITKEDLCHSLTALSEGSNNILLQVNYKTVESGGSECIYKDSPSSRLSKSTHEGRN